jgi:hypothetical protein
LKIKNPKKYNIFFTGQFQISLAYTVSKIIEKTTRLHKKNLKKIGKNREKSEKIGKNQKFIENIPKK